METLYDRPDVREALQALEIEALHAFTGLLSPREFVVLHGRFLGHPPRRQESLGRAMGISRERVRQLEATIITKFDACQRLHAPQSAYRPGNAPTVLLQTTLVIGTDMSLALPQAMTEHRLRNALWTCPDMAPATQVSGNPSQVAPSAGATWLSSLGLAPGSRKEGQAHPTERSRA